MSAPRPWANLQPDEDDAQLDCGCRLRRDGGTVWLDICATHAEAERNLVLLRRYQAAGEQLTEQLARLVDDTAAQLGRVA